MERTILPGHGGSLGYERFCKANAGKDSMWVTFTSPRARHSNAPVVQLPRSLNSSSFGAGIVRDHMDFDDKWFGQQAVYRVSMGNFVSVHQLFLNGLFLSSALCQHPATSTSSL